MRACVTYFREGDCYSLAINGQRVMVASIHDCTRTAKAAAWDACQQIRDAGREPVVTLGEVTPKAPLDIIVTEQGN